MSAVSRPPSSALSSSVSSARCCRCPFDPTLNFDRCGGYEGEMMALMRRVRGVVLLALSAIIACTTAPENPAGVWDATITTAGGLEVPFKFEISGAPPTVTGSFFDGELRRTSAPGSFSNGELVLPFPEYGAKVV